MTTTYSEQPFDLFSETFAYDPKQSPVLNNLGGCNILMAKTAGRWQYNQVHQVSLTGLPYTVDSIEIVIELPELVISEIALSPGQEVPWHFHSNVTDTFYGLSGCTSIRHGIGGRAKLSPGESLSVPSKVPHQVEAFGSDPCRFLLIQGMGKYDFIPAKEPKQ